MIMDQGDGSESVAAAAAAAAAAGLLAGSKASKDFSVFRYRRIEDGLKIKDQATKAQTNRQAQEILCSQILCSSTKGLFKLLNPVEPHHIPTKQPREPSPPPSTGAFPIHSIVILRLQFLLLLSVFVFLGVFLVFHAEYEERDDSCPPKPPIQVSVPGPYGPGLLRIGIGLIRSKVLRETRSILGSSGSIRGRVLWSVGVLMASAAWVWCLYVRIRFRRRWMRLVQGIRERDEKIAQLLHQIAQMNEVLLMKHKDLSSRLRN